jgi:hypothetical protein
VTESAPQEQRPSASINKAGLRALFTGGLVISLSLLVALLAQDGLFTSDPGLPTHPDGLTTLALVLAILAFLVQIFVFVFQANGARASERRSEDLNARTHAALSKIEADSSVTQAVLISQFERLLDYVVDGPDARAVKTESQDLEEPVGIAKGGATHSSQDTNAPVTAAELQRVLSDTLRQRERPTFDISAKRQQPSGEDRRTVDYLRAWPLREEAEATVSELAKLPPLALALLTRYGTAEIRQRLDGRPVGLVVGASRPAVTQRLIDAGLLRDAGDTTVLTDRGRDLVRIMPIGKITNQRPDWYDEVLAPLLQAP